LTPTISAASSAPDLQVPVSSFVYREERMEKGKEEIKR
jgi:hypothetical protein